MGRASSALVALAAALMGLVLVAGQVAAAVSVVWEKDLTAPLLTLSFLYDNAFEPIVATHPFSSQKLAVVYEYRPSTSRCNGIVPGLRTSVDGGSTWQKASGKPWAGSGRIPNYHGTIAWGPGPTAGSARLYWADSTVSDCTFSDHRLSISYSDDRGATWSPLFVASGSAQHGYPDITVDRNPSSPNYGAVYATMNPNVDSIETGMKVLASSDFGRHWLSTSVAALTAPSGYPFRYRNGFRLRAAPDGGLYASFCEVDRASATSGSYGRVAYGIARVRLNRSLGTFSASAPVLATQLEINGYALEFKYAPGTTDRERLYVCWTHGIDVEPASGRVYMAVAGYTTNPAAGSPRGFIRFGRSDDKGQTWSFQRLPALAPDASGRTQSAHKPTLAVRGSKVFVGFHVLTDVPFSTTGIDYTVTVGNAFVVSTDGGGSWGTPRLVSSARWNPNWLDLTINGAGLRDRAEMTAGGRVFWAYGDGRRARAKPDSRWGRCQVYAALIDLG
jgi:hypothetical protein